MPIDAAGTAIGDATASPETLSELREQNEELAATVMQLEEYRQENERLSELLKLANAYSLETTAAHILRPSTDSWNQAITIDKGTQDGLAVGMPVMSPNGLIGQIESVGPYTSQVRLLTDQNSGVAVFLQRDRTEGIVTGSLERLLYLSYIPLNIDVKAGDVVITSGAGGVYPKGIIIGEVTSVRSSPSDVYQTIVIKPSARVKYYEEVLVLTGRQSEVTVNTEAAGTSGTSGTDEAASGTASSGSASSGAAADPTGNAGTASGTGGEQR
jgi:rod shape-determining protein MreC